MVLGTVLALPKRPDITSLQGSNCRPTPISQEALYRCVAASKSSPTSITDCVEVGKTDKQPLVADSRRTSGLMAVFANLFKCYTGAGILSLPFAFRYSGVFIDGVLKRANLYCSRSIKCSQKASFPSFKSSLQSDPDLTAPSGERVLSVKSGWYVTFTICHHLSFSMLEEHFYKFQVDISSRTDAGKTDKQPLVADSRRTSGLMAVFANLFKCYTGAGILSLPFAFRYSGVFAGILCLIVVSILCTISMICLVQCKRKLSKTHSSNLSYSDVVLLLLGRKWSVVLDCVITAFQFGAVIIYFGLILASTIGFVQISEDTVPGLAFDVQLGPPWRTLPLMFGMAAFAFEGAGVVIPTESSMKKPELFNKVLVFVLVCATFMYIAFGVLLYLAFGPQTGLSTGQITENLEQFANHSGDKAFWHFLQSLVRFSLVAGIGMSVTVQLIVVLDIFEKELFKPGRLSTNNLFWKENIIRAGVTLIGLVLAPHAEQSTYHPGMGNYGAKLPPLSFREMGELMASVIESVNLELSNVFPLRGLVCSGTR
eukprot:sb/3463685/